MLLFCICNCGGTLTDEQQQNYTLNDDDDNNNKKINPTYISYSIFKNVIEEVDYA